MDHYDDPDRHMTDEPADDAVARIAQERRDRFAGPLPDTSDAAAEQTDDDGCQWFLRCKNQATTTVAHPILGDVPACARCAKLAA
jgi:hypothetical protein